MKISIEQLETISKQIHSSAVHCDNEIEVLSSYTAQELKTLLEIGKSIECLRGMLSEERIEQLFS